MPTTSTQTVRVDAQTQSETALAASNVRLTIRCLHGLRCAEAKQKMRSGHSLDDEDREPWLDRIQQAIHGWRATGKRIVSRQKSHGSRMNGPHSEAADAACPLRTADPLCCSLVVACVALRGRCSRAPV